MDYKDIEDSVVEQLYENNISEIIEQIKWYVRDAIEETISEDTIITEAEEQLDGSCIYTADCNETICEYGLKEAVEQFATVEHGENGEHIVKFSPEYAAAAIMRENIDTDSVYEALEEKVCDLIDNLF